MKDELKKYVENNRDAFELENDSLDGLWLNISSRIQKKQKKDNFWRRDVWRIAAIMLVFLGLAWLLIVRPISQNKKQLSDMYSFSPELAEAEGYYSSLIDAKMKQINFYREEIDPQIFEDLDALDEVLLELENDLRDNIDNEEVINAMIKNYRIKLEILEQIQRELEQNENVQIES